jgi:WD40 repeat protein
VQVWDATTGNRFSSYRFHQAQVNAIAWSHDGKRIASSDGNGLVQVWDASRQWNASIAPGADTLIYQGHLTPTPSPFSGVQAVAWSPDDKRIASGGTDGTVQVWDAISGHTMLTYRGHQMAGPKSGFPPGLLGPILEFTTLSFGSASQASREKGIVFSSLL